jgi:hypothetical protein
MCEHCLDEITEGKRPPVTDAMRDLAGLCWDWYRMPGNDTGGPLHITLDDMNVEDSNIEFCRTNGLGPDGFWPPERDALLTQICDGLLALSEGERAMVVHIADPYGEVRP